MVESEYENYEILQNCVQEYYDTTGYVMNLPIFGSCDSCNRKDFKEKISISKGKDELYDYNYMTAVSNQMAAAASRFRDDMRMSPVFKASYSASNNNLIDISATSKLDVEAVAQATTKIIDNGAGSGKMSLWVPETYADFNSDRPLWSGNSGTSYGNVEIKLTPSESPLMTIKEEAGKAAAYLVSKDAVAVRYNRNLIFSVFDEDWEDRYSIVGNATAESVIVNKKGIIKILFKTS